MVLSMNRWVGKIAVVTGASSGIGASIAESLVKNGLIVVGLARRIDRIQEQSQKLSNFKGKLHGIQVDMTKESDIIEAFKWITTNLGIVHILINCAGCSKEALLSEGNTEDWKKIFDVNVIALCIATREALKIMKENSIKGHVVHMNSILGHSIMNVTKVNVYPASKHAVTALTETMRQELISLDSPIKITSISPGLVVSEMTVLRKDISEERKHFFKSRPILNGEDIADAVVYVLSTPEHVQVHELMIKPVGEPC